MEDIASNLYLKTEFNNFIDNILKLCKRLLSQESWNDYERFVKMIINGYRLNYIKSNVNKRYQDIDNKYVIKCMLKLFKILDIYIYT